MIQLYHYVHCPYCVRVRMVLGHLNIAYESIVVSYDDEETPLQLCGKKMLPILRKDGQALNESLDIIALLDQKNVLNRERYYQRAADYEILLNRVGNLVHNLAMPYWIWTPEFSDSSRNYFRAKKEKKRGPFELLVNEAEVYKTQLNELLQELQSRLKPYFDGERFSLVDIVVAAHLWGAYVVPEWQFEPAWHEYLQHIKKICRFDYHRDFWSVALGHNAGVRV